MKNNIHEDKSFSKTLKQHQTDQIISLDIPKWITQIECPFCKKELTPFSIRGINFKTNARNFGDVCIDFMCESCSVGDNMYFRKAFSTKEEMIAILLGEKEIDPKLAVLEENMYKLGYNNSMESMLESMEATNGNSKNSDDKDQT